MSTESSWEREARNWIAWARTPGHDVFSYYAPAFFREIVPPSEGITLEIGCGEGRVSRELAARGHTIVGIDASWTLVSAAREADSHSAYLTADATAVPFADATFQTIVAYNSLQTMGEVTDMPAAVREASRVLMRSGRFCMCVAHPMTDLGLGHVPSGADPSRLRSYFERQRVNETVTQDGREMTFTGWTYTLADYASALEAAGLVIERLREPVPAQQQVVDRPSLQRWRRLPYFLSIRAAKR